MAAKLTDADVASIRAQGAEGRSARVLAAEFGCSARHVGRILRGDVRRQLGGLDEDTVRSASVLAALERFLDGLDLTPADAVLAETARALAAKLDAARASDAAAAASAAPQIAQGLLAVVAELRGDDAAPDALDDLRRRREARRLAARAAG